MYVLKSIIKDLNRDEDKANELWNSITELDLKKMYVNDYINFCYYVIPYLNGNKFKMALDFIKDDELIFMLNNIQYVIATDLNEPLTFLKTTEKIIEHGRLTSHVLLGVSSDVLVIIMNEVKDGTLKHLSGLLVSEELVKMMNLIDDYINSFN